MKIRHEIAEFLAFKVAQGLTPHSVRLCEQALTALLGHVLEEPGDSLTPERMVELGGQLRKRPSPRTDKPLAEGTLKTYLAACRRFIRWRTLRRPPHDPAESEPSPSATTEATAEPSSAAPLHTGELARRLREAQGLKRSEMTAQTGLTANEIRGLELGRDSAPKTWRALLGHPAMQGLPELAQKAGLTLPSEDPGKRAVRRPLTVADTIGLYLDSQYERGMQNNSLVTAAAVLRSFFRSALHAPLADLSPDQARQMADELSERIGTHTKRPLTKPTCRRYRVQASLFLRWCVEQKRLPGNPLDSTGEDAGQAEREQRPAEPPEQEGQAMSAQDLKVTLAASGQPAAEVPAASLHEARACVVNFIRRNELDAAEVPAACGVIRHEGKPIARVDPAGRVWELRGDETATGAELVLAADRLGHLVRELRTAAGLTRAAMGDAVNLSEADLKDLEIGRRVTAPTLRAVLAHPAMRDLPEQAERQGLDLNTFLNSADDSATRG
jgi:transcriptional regulator with XRE-family HTH domain